MPNKSKCKQCKEYFVRDSDNPIEALWVKFCSKSCRRSYIAQKNKEKIEKQKLKKQKAKTKKANSVSSLTKKADKLWSEAVKIEYNHECQYCWKKEYLNSHHLFTRARRATRWDIDNGMCLCSGCHTLSSKFSAHQTPLEFFEWLEWIRGRDWIDNLSKRSRAICSVSSELLHDKIKELELYIKESK